MGEIYALLSGKGGTGKTSVCAGLACALAEQGCSVLCIDCDVGLRNLDISLGLSDCGALSFLDLSEGGYPASGVCSHGSYPNLDFLTAPMNVPVEKIDIAAFRSLLLKLRGQYDFILLDAAAGVDAGFRLVSAAAERFLVVTGAGPAAVRDARRISDLLELAGKKDVRMIVNRVDRDLLYEIRLTIDDVMDESGLPLTGVVPEDAHVTLAAAFGLPLMKYARRCDAAKAFRRIARRLQGYREPIGLK